jgi:MFS family permease
MMDYRMTFTFVMGLVLGIIFLNIPPALDTLMILYSVSYTEISILISALLWTHALMQIPSGIITDRIGIKKSLLLCIVFMGVGGFIPALIPHIFIAVMGRVVVGIGTGLSFTTTMKLIALYAPGGRVGTFQAFFASAFSLGSILAYQFIPSLMKNGWQAAYLSAAVPCLLLLAMVLPMDLESDVPSDPNPLPMGRVFRIRLAWIIGLYHAICHGSILTLGSWMPTLLSEVWQSPGAAQYAWSGVLVMFISGLGRISGGFVLYRIRPFIIVNGSILILMILFTGLYIVPIPNVVLFLAMTSALFAAINFGAIFHIASGATHAGSLGTLLGLINLLANLGPVLFTLMFGYFKDTFGSLSNGFGVMAVMSLIALLLGQSAIRRSSA